jgi:alpha-galactosidase
MVKIAMIGAGSVVFSKNLTGDILGYPEFKDATLAYMDIDKERLEVGTALCRKVAKALGANPTIEAYTDRRKAVAGADFVINMVQIGGFDSTLVDFEIPRKYGLNFTIADTTGPGGLFRAMRTYPMLSGLCQDMEAVCPNAWLLNYSNPMSMNMQTIYRTSSIRAVGLCHSVQGTFNQLMRYIGEKPDEIAFICAGINHMAFYLKMEKQGVNLYPRLFEAMGDPKHYNTNRVRFELMKRLGYFVTESSEHNAEYCPYFIPHGRTMVDRFGVPIDEYLRRCDGIVDHFNGLIQSSKNDEPIQVHRSHEYGSTIIHSIVSGKPSVVYGNMPNRGTITSLPATAIAEAPTLVDRNGCQFTQVGELPPQLVAYMNPHITQHELFIRACMEGRKDHVYQACMFDPLTAATMSLDKIVEMCDELIACHGKLLPKLTKPTLVPGSGIKFKATSAKSLRQQWEAQKQKLASEAVSTWQLTGAFTGAAKLSYNPGIEAALVAATKTGLASMPAQTVKGQPVVLKTAKTDMKGIVNLNRLVGIHEQAVVYGYAEVDSIHARDAVLKIGSDDGVAVWLNGVKVHTHDVARGHNAGDDEVKVHLSEGTNRLLVKVHNQAGGWAFSVAIPQPTF